MSLKSPSQPISTVTESCMKEECGRRHSKKLLDFHEIIVGQILNARCACSCHSRPERKLFNKILYYDIHSNVNDNKGSSQKVRTTTWTLIYNLIDILFVFKLVLAYPFRSLVRCNLSLVDIGCRLTVPSMVHRKKTPRNSK
jgi:hypothetical protein